MAGGGRLTGRWRRGGLQDIPSRPRRNRRSHTIRAAISETHLSPANFILPVFVHDGEKNDPILTMPGVDRLGWRHGLIEHVREARSYGVNQVVIFPKVRCGGAEAVNRGLRLGCAPNGSSGIPCR